MTSQIVENARGRDHHHGSDSDRHRCARAKPGARAHGTPTPAGGRLGLWGGASGIGLAAGPVLGGVLIAAFGWRAIFLVNVPIAAAAALFLVRHVEETR